MSKIGGDTVCKTVRNVMSLTIADELAQIYTWTGQKKRLALKKTKISDVIIGTYIHLFYSYLHNILFICFIHSAFNRSIILSSLSRSNYDFNKYDNGRSGRIYERMGATSRR